MNAILRKREYHIKNKIIHIAGSKNSALAILPAMLLAKGIYQISNVDLYSDTKNMIYLLEQCGIYHYPEKNIFDTTHIKIPSEFSGCEKIRASYYLAGAIVHSKSIIQIGLPGGCRLGNDVRKIDEHLKILEFIGCKISENSSHLIVDSTGYRFDLSGEFTFDTKSVGATVNALLSMVKGSGQIILHNIEKDPIVTELVKFLNAMNAKITILSEENTIIVNRVRELIPTNYSIIPDPIITGTYIIFISMLPDPSQFIIGPCIKNNMGNFLNLVEMMGISLINYSGDYYQIKVMQFPKEHINIIRTGNFPELYTDLQPFIALYLHHKNVPAIIIDDIMPGRYYYAIELNKLGYQFKIDNNQLIIGNNLLPIITKKIGCHDLRGSMALLIAGTIGIIYGRCHQIIIKSYPQIERGYFNIAKILELLDIECLITNSSLKELPDGQINKQLSEICSIGIGGTIDHFMIADSYANLISCVKKCIDLKIPYRVIGNGTNIYFEDKHYHGMIISNQTSFIKRINHYPSDEKEGYFVVATGTSLDYLVNYLANNSYDLSELAGIPGTVGGAIYGNAGAYGREIKDIIKFATLIKPNGEITNFSTSDFHFGYRKSILSEMRGYTIISAIISVKHNDTTIIHDKISNIIALRKSKLPSGEKTAGSFFKNFNLESAKIPTGHIITKIKEMVPIENGPIKLYEKHNNIIINDGNATHCDLTTFVEKIRETTMEKFGIWLDNEVLCIHPEDLWSAGK